MFTTDELIRVVKGTPFRVKRGVVKGISCDSRTIKKGMAFFALKGKRFDGHNFLLQAKKKGAVVCVAEKRVDNIPTILVRDTLKALGDLAAYYRRKFKVRVVAITGSNGKTTTKNLIASLLSINHKVLKSPRSYNNLIGLPLTLLKLKSHDIAVVEMGMSGKGEIKRLCRIADPEIGVITNIGPAHLEFLKDMERVREAKLELLEYLKDKGMGIVNGDDRLLKDLRKRGNIYTFGIYEPADLRPERIELGTESTRFWIKGEEYRIGLLGLHNVYNSLASLLCAELIERKRDSLWRRVLRDMKPEPMRTQIYRRRGITIINDAYNANPYSMRSAFQVLSLFYNKRRIAVLGDMKELGESSERFHKEIGREAGRIADIVVAVGDQARFYNGLYFKTKREAMRFLRGLLKPGDVVLIKGSRATRMEEIAASIMRG